MRILVLYVDRDGDLKREGIPTPVLGRDDVLRLGIRYMLANPDDSDANAVFAAVKLHDRLAQEYGRENVSVAVVSGSPDPALADLAVLRELEEVLAQFDADSIYFVSDGPSDEAAVPAVQAKRPVVSVMRVVVKQARGVEETVTLFRYYLNKAVRDPEYRKYTVGAPSLVAFLLALAALLQSELVGLLLRYMLLFVLFLLAMYGFGMYDVLRAILRRYEYTFPISIFSLFLLIIYLIEELPLPGGALRELLPIGSQAAGVVAALPFASYMVEAYIRERRLKYGAIAAGAAAAAFPAVLFPALVRGDQAARVAALLQYVAVVAASSLVAYVARRALRGGAGT